MKKACAQHILVKTEKQCLEIKEKLAKGADFSQMAKRFSTCPSGKRGGDLGSSPRGHGQVLRRCRVQGELLTVLGPVRTKFGFHLIKVLYRS